MSGPKWWRERYSDSALLVALARTHAPPEFVIEKLWLESTARLEMAIALHEKRNAPVIIAMADGLGGLDGIRGALQQLLKALPRCAAKPCERAGTWLYDDWAACDLHKQHSQLSDWTEAPYAAALRVIEKAVRP